MLFGAMTVAVVIYLSRLISTLCCDFYFVIGSLPFQLEICHNVAGRYSPMSVSGGQAKRPFIYHADNLCDQSICYCVENNCKRNLWPECS